MRSETVSQDRSASTRSLGDPAVLLALAFIVLGAVALGMLLTPQPPAEDSPEAGFAWDMSNHHSQAVEMAEIVRDRTQDPEIRILAADIALTQQGQIGEMQAWLDMWGLSQTSPEPAMSWMGHPTGGRMPGMASPQEINALRNAPSQQADTQFLRLMIPHHQAAVMMAEDVLERSNQPQVVDFAQRS